MKMKTIRHTVVLNVTFILVLAVTISCGFFENFTTTAYADELFIAPNMLLSSGDYHGVFVRTDDTVPALVQLTSNSDILQLPDSVFIPAGKNHALFDVSLHGIGDAQVIAKVGNTFWNATTYVSDEINSNYRILLVFPEKISTSKINGALYFVDDFFNPVYVNEDTKVSLIGTEMDTPESVVVSAGNSHAFFSIDVHGSNSALTAYTDDSISDTVKIDYDKASFEVHIGVAPKVIAPNSFGYVFAWITDEKSGNRIYPPLPISSQLHVSDGNVLSVDGVFSSKETIHLRDGFYHSEIFTHDTGESTVTVSVPGYGTVSELITVFDYDDKSSSSSVYENLKLEKPNHMKTNIFPPVTDSDSYLVLSMYHDIYPIDSDTTTTYPVYGVESSEFAIVSQNLSHDNLIDFSHDGIKSQSMIVPISGNIAGNHTVSVSSVGIPISESALQIEDPATYGLLLTSLPPLSEKEEEEFRPLHLISVVDSSGFVVDPHYVFGDLTVRLFSDDDIQFRTDTIRLSEPVTILYGKSKIDYPTITAIAQNENIVSTHKSIPQNNLEIDIQIPNSVHIGEPFPAYAYLMADQKPISAISNYLSSDCNSYSDDDDDDDGLASLSSLFTCKSSPQPSSQFEVFENRIGFAAKSIDMFENIFEDGDIQVDFGNNDVLYIGSQHKIIFDLLPDDISFDTVSSIPFDIIADNSLILKPESAGKHDVFVTFSKPGYAQHTEYKMFTVNDEIIINVSATDQKGAILHSATVNTVSSSVGDDTNLQVVKTPSSFTAKRGTVHLEFLPSVEVGTVSYVFDHVVVVSDDDDHDATATYNENILDLVLLEPTSIQAVYKNIINIDVMGGVGTGLYEYGDAVTIDSKPRDVAWFLIRDVFDSWTYLPAGYDIYSSKVELVAEQSFETAIVYRPDYSGLVMTVILAVFVLFGYLRKERLVGIIRTYTEKK